MRIIAGQAGSIPIEVPRSMTRPTTDRVREAMFSSLANRIPGSDVLDLFAGSGALGLEALSRGATSATFVDSSRDSIRVIEGNLRKSNLPGGRIQQRDALAFAAGLAPASFDLIFADPPYAKDEDARSLLESLLHAPAIVGLLREEGLLVLESWSKLPLPDSPAWNTTREKVYGSTRVSFLRPAS